MGRMSRILRDLGLKKSKLLWAEGWASQERGNRRTDSLTFPHSRHSRLAREERHKGEREMKRARGRPERKIKSQS